MKPRIYGLETEYALSVETEDRRLKPVDPGMLFKHLETDLRSNYPNVESDSFGRRPDQQRGDGIGIREGRFLESGARFYYDTGHVEWSTPETTSARAATLYELAGERTLAEIAHSVSMPHGTRLLLLKNNIDYVSGTTFGCHENYLVRREAQKRDDRVFFERLTRHLVPFLVTRQIFCGAGRVGTADPAPGHQVSYQISQRADFIERVTSEETRSERAIINTRDEPLGDATHHRRLHLILGDSNRSQVATLLKLGTTGLVLHLIEEDLLRHVPELKEPVAALRSLSRDLTCRNGLALKGGGTASPIEIQRFYLEAARAAVGESTTPSAERQVLALWGEVLEDLENDPARAADRVDWLIKRQYLLDPLLAQSGTSWEEVSIWSELLAEIEGQRETDAPGFFDLTSADLARFQYLADRHRVEWGELPGARRLFFALRERDLRYHDLDPERSLFALLEKHRRVRPLLFPSEVQTAQRHPPADTRARLRAEVIRWAHDAGLEKQTLLDWGRAALPKPWGEIQLPDPFAHDPEVLRNRLATADTGNNRSASNTELAIRILETVPIEPPHPPETERDGKPSRNQGW